MKKLFPILTMALAIFAGSLSIETHAKELNANDVLTAEEKITADAEKAKADAWVEGKDLAEKYTGLDDDGKLAKNKYKIDAYHKSGDTAWMIVATALVLLMTIPGLSLFYGGLARRKNVLSVPITGQLHFGRGIEKPEQSQGRSGLKRLLGSLPGHLVSLLKMP